MTNFFEIYQKYKAKKEATKTERKKRLTGQERRKRRENKSAMRYLMQIQ